MQDRKPNILFNRLVLMAERTGNIVEYFNYEMTSSPMSLFKNGYMRKPDKLSLYRKVVVGLNAEQLPDTARYVVDGGYLLHKLRWAKGSTIHDIMNAYISLVLFKFRSSPLIVVFDGYGEASSTKDHEHKRRAGKVAKVAPDILITPSLTINFDQEAVLANTTNKRQFIELLMQYMNKLGIVCKQSHGDADTDIVANALEAATADQVPAVVFAEDTDVFALLVYHWKPHMADIYFYSDGKGRTKIGEKCINIQKIQAKLGVDACSKILALHAFGGCDTTSAIFGHKKGAVFSKLSQSGAVCDCLSVIQNPNASTESVGQAGQQLMVSLYGGARTETLGHLRYSYYCKLLLGRHFQAERLPPSPGAAYFHALRTHLQVVEWESLGQLRMEPTHWGWKLENGSLIPRQTDCPVAPDDLLKFVRCRCEKECKSTLCSCRRNALQCVAACSHCHGGGDCSNAIDLDDDEIEDVDIDLETEYMLDDDLCYLDEEVVDEVTFKYM